MKSIAAGVATVLAMMVVISLYNDATFLATRAAVARILVSVGAGVFAVFWVAGVASFFASGYFFFKMVNSPQRGQTIFDARMLKGKSLFSDRYLSDEGKATRSRLFQSLRWFGACWIGGVCLGLLAEWLVKFG